MSLPLPTAHSFQPSPARSILTTLEALVLGDLLGMGYALSPDRFPIIATTVILWIVLALVGVSYWRGADWILGAASAVIWGLLAFAGTQEVLGCPGLAPIAGAFSGSLAAYLRISK